MGKIIVKGKKAVLNAKRGFNKMLYVNADALNEKTEKKIAECNSMLSLIEKERKDMKAMKAKTKIEKPDKVKKELKFKLPTFNFKSLFEVDETEGEAEAEAVFYYDEKDKEYLATEIEVNAIFDENLKELSSVKGKSLLAMDFAKNVVYIKDDKSNVLRVQKAFEVVKDDQKKDEKFILLETEYMDFVVRFEVSY